MKETQRIERSAFFFVLFISLAALNVIFSTVGVRFFVSNASFTSDAFCVQIENQITAIRYSTRRAEPTLQSEPNENNIIMLAH